MNSADLWDVFVGFMYNGSYTTKLVDMLKNRKVKSVIDCSCGTGFPAIHLKKKGFDVFCSDDSKKMINKFEENLKKKNIHIPHMQCRWQNLNKHFNSEFDALLCRGNSLIYATSWDKKEIDVEQSKIEIKKSLRNFYDVLKPGGFCYIDLPPEKEFLDPKKIFITRWAKKRILNDFVSALLTVELDRKRRVRIWTPKLLFWDNQSAKVTKIHSRRFKGYMLTPEELISLMKNTGFKNVKPLKFASEKNYSVFVAEK